MKKIRGKIRNKNRIRYQTKRQRIYKKCLAPHLPCDIITMTLDYARSFSGVKRWNTKGWFSFLFQRPRNNNKDDKDDKDDRDIVYVEKEGKLCILHLDNCNVIETPFEFTTLINGTKRDELFANDKISNVCRIRCSSFNHVPKTIEVISQIPPCHILGLFQERYLFVYISSCCEAYDLMSSSSSQYSMVFRRIKQQGFCFRCIDSSRFALVTPYEIEIYRNFILIHTWTFGDQFRIGKVLLFSSDNVHLMYIFAYDDNFVTCFDLDRVDDLNGVEAKYLKCTTTKYIVQQENRFLLTNEQLHEDDEEFGIDDGQVHSDGRLAFHLRLGTGKQTFILLDFETNRIHNYPHVARFGYRFKTLDDNRILSMRNHYCSLLE